MRNQKFSAFKNGIPGEIRTCDLPLKSLVCTMQHEPDVTSNHSFFKE